MHLIGFRLHNLNRTVPELQEEIPDRDIQQAQAYHHKAHYAAGGESDSQARVQAFAGAVGGAAVGIGRDLHADKAGQGGEEASGQERNRHKGGQEPGDGQDQQDNEHNREENSHAGILALQISVGAFPDSAGDFLHQVGALVSLHNSAGKEKSEQQSYYRADRSKDGQIHFNNLL